ncbi:NUDIX hydrolase [Spirulina sp. 06S082]|uniref:NUDIX hydrolase n=1 Tax=Spirulina sp. 06S082 TaxID=3110248 RepID=UPI002B21CA0E|nr:NUDIX hydrolase [Spirulina sp. 06S082]MEA5471324.1 NUDIX hydrolase [Spirulina sp. 06S082]
MTVEVAIAILYQNGNFLMQLRDNVPNIAAPGCWGFFGGHLDPGETPEVALVRELIEEISYEFSGTLVKFGCYPSDGVMRHIFTVPLLVPLTQLELKEGWDFALVTPDEILQGERFSEIANQIRPLSSIHRQILLDYLQQNNSTKSKQ